MRLKDPRLAATDRILQRWAVSVGSGLPSDAWNDVPKSRPPPLPDDICIQVDKIICKSPQKWQRLIHSWYRTPRPTEILAMEQKCSVSTVTVRWHACLEDMRVSFCANRIIIKLYGSRENG